MPYLGINIDKVKYVKYKMRGIYQLFSFSWHTEGILSEGHSASLNLILLHYRRYERLKSL